jgi:hypothetical protein
VNKPTMPAICEGAEARDCGDGVDAGVLGAGSEDDVLVESSLEDEGGIIMLGSTAVTIVDVAAPPMEKNMRARRRSG